MPQDCPEASEREEHWSSRKKLARSPSARIESGAEARGPVFATARSAVMDFPVSTPPKWVAAEIERRTPFAPVPESATLRAEPPAETRSSAPKRCSEEGRKSTWRSQLDPGCSDAPVQPSETTANASGCAPTRAVVSVGVTWAPPFVMRTATSSDESPGEVVVNSTSPRSAMSCDGAGAARCAPHATQSAKNPSIDRDMNPPSAMCGSDEGAASEGIQAA